MSESGLSREELKENLKRQPKQLPVSCLYDKRGSDLYEEITALPEYYPFNEESRLLKANAQGIIAHIERGSIILELGCGSAAKTGTILNAIADRDGPTQLRFVGIDVSQQALDLASESLLQHCPLLLPGSVDLICADYLDGLKTARARYADARICILWLGSSVGNLNPQEALSFFQQVLAICGPRSQVLLCTDLWKDREVLHAAYHDSQGVTEAFIKNGMVNALKTLGVRDAPSLVNSWRYDVRVNKELQQVEMWLHATSAAVNGQRLVEEGEAVLMEVSRKFTMADVRSLAFKSGWFIQQAWSSGKYGMHMLVPQLEAVRRCQADTDAFFAAIADWTNHPIDVRHPFVFYYGHIAAFASIKAFPKESVTSMLNLFSRGIDIDLADTSHCCNSHPDIPAEWPSPQETCSLVQKLRTKYLEGLQQGKVETRTVWLNLEHERMHLETLAYMRAQARKKAFDCQAAAAANGFHSNGHNSGDYTASSTTGSDRMIAVAAGRVILGIDDNPTKHFVWDNEGPKGSPVSVDSFKVAPSPCTIQEFHEFVFGRSGYATPKWWDPVDLQILQKRDQIMPATWSLAEAGDSDGESVFVHRPEGSYHWRQVADEPVWLSLAEAQAFAKSRSCRIMTEPEYQRILDDAGACSRVQHMRDGGWEWTSTNFAPFPGFEPMAEYPEYSADFFDGKHCVLKGSAPCTHPSLLRDSFRNFYQKQYPYVFAKFRLCSD